MIGRYGRTQPTKPPPPGLPRWSDDWKLKAMLEPLYTTANCRPAYQLNWTLSVFWKEAVEAAPWLEALKEATEPDGVRILEHRFSEPGVSQFILSTKPEVAPQQFVRSVKGRLQYLVRDKRPKAFQRNYGFRSVGSAKRDLVERYVGDQLGHHPMADPDVQKRLEHFQITRDDVDLSRPRHSSHGVYWHNLHIVFVHDGRYMEIREDRLAAVKDMLLRATVKHGRLLSRAAVLSDHVHLTVGCDVGESPAEVAVGYMNNLAFTWGMKAVYQFGYYVGTFGEYDRGVVAGPSR